MSLATSLAIALDPVELARRAGFEPDGWQADLLRSTAQQILLNCSRQSGKSTLAALVSVHELLARQGALVLLLAPSLRQAQELQRKTRSVLASLGDIAPAITTASALAIEIETGSRLIVLPGSEATVRGYSAPSLLVIDEAARIEDSLYAALRPMLAVSKGRLILLSTPWRKLGAFYSAWSEGGAEWHRVRLPATECPRIDSDWLEQERRSLPDHVFRQEYLCEFGDDEEQLFSTEAIRGALSFEVRPLFAPRTA